MSKLGSIFTLSTLCIQRILKQNSLKHPHSTIYHEDLLNNKITSFGPCLYSSPTLPNSHAEIPVPNVKGTGDNCMLIRKKLRNKETETTVHKKWQCRKFPCSVYM